MGLVTGGAGGVEIDRSGEGVFVDDILNGFGNAFPVLLRLS